MNICNLYYYFYKNYVFFIKIKYFFCIMTYNFEIINIVIEKIINKVNFNIISKELNISPSTITLWNKHSE